MLTSLAKILKAEKGEERAVLLLFILGFFMGIYIYSYKIVAEAIFLSRLEDYLAEAMFISAGLGVISAALYSHLQNRIPFYKITFLNLIIIFVFLASNRILYAIMDDKSLNVLAFISFVMIQPIMSVALLNFWGIFGRIFNLRQSKRIIGGIDSGQLLAAFITSLSIPIFAKFLVEIDFLYISLIAIVINIGILSLIIKNFDLETHSDESAGRVNTKITSILKEKYVIYLSVFLLLSIISFQFVHYSFLSVTKIYYPTESQLVSFLGYFNAFIMILSLIIQTFVNERLIAMYGLKTTLLVLPVILGLFTAISIFIGFLFGFTAQSPTFIWFFLFVALSKLFNESLRESLETPSFKLFFMPLDIKIRFDIQAKVEGVINEFSRLIAGFIILFLGFLSFFKLIHYSVILVAVIIVWIWSTSKLYSEYRNNVKKKLQGQKAEHESKQKSQRLIKDIIDNLEKYNLTNNLIFALKLLEKYNTNLFRAYINKFVQSKNKQIKRFALDKMSELRTVSHTNNRVFKLDKSNGAQSLAQLLDNLGSEKSINHYELMSLLRSDKIEDRKYLAGLMVKNSDHNSSILLELLDDLDDGVKSAAIKSIGTAKIKETYPLLIEELKSPKFSDKAVSAFSEIGEEAFPYLDAAFYKSGQNIKIMLKVLQIYGKVGGEKAINLLWDKIDYPDKKIVAQVLFSLGECDFLANESQVRRIKFAIDNDLANIAWTLNAVNRIPDGIGTEELKKALNYDIQSSIKHIFMLLSMLYDSHSIKLVQENLFGKTGEGLTYAIELLDVFLSEDIKEKIIFMLDDVLESKELNKLENYYPQNDLKFTEILNLIINRDFNLTNRWTKACAIYYLGQSLMEGYEMDIIANLFNPDPLLKEVSARSLFKINPALFRFHITRFDIGTSRNLENMIDPTPESNSHKTLRFEKVLLLSRLDVFKSVAGFILSNIIEMSQELHLKKGTEIILDKEKQEQAFLILKGKTRSTYEDGSESFEQEGEFVSGFFEVVGCKAIYAITDCNIVLIEKGKFYDYVAADTDLIISIIEKMENKDKIKSYEEEALLG